MKKFNYFLSICAVTLFLFSSCKKDNSVVPEPNGETEQIQSISEETRNAIEIDLGEIGLTIDTRKLAVLGYQPAKVNVQIDGSLSSYSQDDIEVDEFTNLANFKFSVEDLTEDVMDALSNGVNLSVVVFDENGTALESAAFTNEAINSHDKTLVVETNKVTLLDIRDFNPSIPYYMIVLSGPNGTDVADGAPSLLGGYTYDQTNGDALDFSNRGNLGILQWDENEESVFAKSQKFYFEDMGNDVYRIRTEFEGAYLELDDNNGDSRLFWNKEEIFDFDDRHEFIFEKTHDGFVKIKSVRANSYLVQDPYTLEIATDYQNNDWEESHHLKFRFITTGVLWDYNPIDTKYSAAIIPTTNMQFGAEVTLKNCSDATLEQTFGTSESKTSTYTTSTSESVSMYGTNTSGWSASVTATASASLFGVGGEISATGAISGEQQSGFENNYSTSVDISESEAKEFSQELSVTVGPHTAIELYNATQIIKDIKMPFVTRIKIQGNQNGINLTGNQIVSQLVASRFPGAITKVDSDNVVVSVRGDITVDQYFKTASNVNDIDGACE